MYEHKYHSVDLSKISVLVTGGAGFIGSNIVEYLIKYGVKKVRVLDNFATGFHHNINEFKALDNFELLEGDIRDLDTCKKAVENIDYVLHQAALGSVPRSINDPITSNDVNVNGHLNMLVAVKESETVKRMVYAASSSTYGDSKNLPKVEDIIGKPLSPYAVTKYVNELYADVFARTYGVDTIGLRYFNVFGPKQDPNGAYAAVIPLFMKSIVDKVSPKINGDGKQTRDFTFVENAVQANIKAMLADGISIEDCKKEISDNSCNSRIYNVAVGDRTGLLDMWQSLREIAKNNAKLISDNSRNSRIVEAIHGPDRVGDIKDSLADISKAKEGFGYQPKFNIYEGLKITFNWFISDKNLTNK